MEQLVQHRMVAPSGRRKSRWQQGRPHKALKCHGNSLFLKFCPDSLIIILLLSKVLPHAQKRF